MTNKANIRIGTLTELKMALVLIVMMAAATVEASSSIIEMALTNITRFSAGDFFSLNGLECGPTRCMEQTHGTALPAINTDEKVCRCQCRSDKPAFREDQGSCVNYIEECRMATFGHEAEIPLVYLPHKGQIINPAKHIEFTNIADAVCAVTSAQYLSSSGWTTLRDLVDNDVPFGLYRDEGNTFLQWLGSPAIHARLEGRLVAVHVVCSGTSSGRLVASCAAFRIAGTSANALVDIRSIPFHSGEIVTETPPTQGLSVIESLAIGVCVLLLVFVYAAGIVFYVHYKQRLKGRQKDPEQHDSNIMTTDKGAIESRIDMCNVMLKTNPLLQLNGISGDFFHDSKMPDMMEHSEDNLDVPSQNNQTNTHKFQKLNTNVISAMVHSRRKKTLRASDPVKDNERFQRRSMSPDALERAPHSDLSIVDCSMENNFDNNNQLPTSNGENVYRKKLYFNPVFFEPEHLKNPPPAAIEFLVKIREVMSVAKEKMSSKKYIPILSDIPEEDIYQAIDLGWDIPCARRGRRFSAISLKQENSRKSAVCGGCPGCDNSSRSHKAIELARSNSCKTCVSEDYKQKIIRKWLDEVPLPKDNTRPVKSVAKINVTLRNEEMQQNDAIGPKSVEPIKDNLKKLLPDSKSKIKVAQSRNIEPKPNAQEKPSKIIENNSLNTEIKPKLSEIKMKSCETKTEIKPKITEMIAKDSPEKIVKDKNVTEMKPKERKILKRPMNLKEIEIIKLDDIDKGGSDIEKISKPVVTNLEKTSPAPNHTSRRIRKKLPPPPPPPVIPPKSPKSEEDEPSIPSEVKVKMEAVIRQFKTCRRVELTELEDVKMETIAPIAPKLVIPVLAADSHYYSDDNLLTLSRKKDILKMKENFMEFDSLERNAMKRRRFSVACTPEVGQRTAFELSQNLLKEKDRLRSTSWRDMNKAVEEDQVRLKDNINIGEVFINNNYIEPIYDNVDELIKPGPLTIQVRGSPVETRRNFSKDDSDFDPDTLDRRETKKRVEKILLKSAGSFKYKSTSSESEFCPKSPIITRKICNLRLIYEAKAKAQEQEMKFYGRRQSIAYGQDLSALMRSAKAPDLIRHLESQQDPKPPIPPKQRRGTDLSSKFTSSMRESPSGDRRRSIEERFQQYTRLDNINARRSGRRSARTRSRRTDLRKLYRTEDSGYMSTDSNESKRRATYLMQLKPTKTLIPVPIPAVRVTTKTAIVQVDSDTDDLESLCDGRSESGGESVETDSVFFGNLDDSKEMFAELGLKAFEPQNKMVLTHEQIDSGFMGEVNIILSGDSDSEHRSVISINTGHDGRASAASISQLDDTPYMQSIEC